MNEKVAKRVEYLIYAKGFPSIRQFAEYLKREHLANSLSEDTINNFINGNGFQNNTLTSIAIGLGLPIDCLTAETLPLVDSYLFNEIAEEKALHDADKSRRKDYEINDLKILKYYYDIDKRMYPGKISRLNNENEFFITTLGKLSLYLPLCNWIILSDIFQRIYGHIEGYERYIVEKYDYLYETIPDIPAKRFVDCQVCLMRLSNKTNLSEEEIEKLKELKEYKKSKEWEDGLNQYMDIVNRIKDVLNNLIVRDVLKARFPEIYG